MFAALVHLGLSLAIAAVCAVLVFKVWYPAPFGEMSGASMLFYLIVAVDVVLGPLITLLIFDTRKPRQALRRDLTMVAVLQLLALFYGLHTVAQVRPVAIALEVDRLRVVSHMDMRPDAWAKAPADLRRNPWFGIVHVATRKIESHETEEAIFSAIAGLDIGARPEFWLPLSATRAALAQSGRTMSQLRRLQPQRNADIDAAIAATGKAEVELKFLPIIARRSDFVALIDGTTGDILGYANLDGH